MAKTTDPAGMPIQTPNTPPAAAPRIIAAHRAGPTRSLGGDSPSSEEFSWGSPSADGLRFSMKPRAVRIILG